jgi:hypothetical protein
VDVEEVGRRRRAAQRALLETVSLDSPLMRRHQANLARAGNDPAARLAVYEATVKEAGLTRRYEALVR